MTPAPTATPEQSVDVGQRPGRAFRVLAIDPGPVESAYVVFDGEHVLSSAKLANEYMLIPCANNHEDYDAMVIEKIASYGMSVGAEVFETCVWTGRFMQAWNDDERCNRLTRIAIKTALCHSARATDANIRQALIDRFGGKEAAIGRKKTPGPLHRIKGDCWSALAVAVVWYDQHVASARCQSGAEAGG